MTRAMGSAEQDEVQPAIACKLSEAQLCGRRDELMWDVFAHCQGVTELHDGYEFTFPGGDELTERVLSLVLQEMRCCPFFRFELVIEPEAGPITLRLRGGAGVKEFIEGVLLQA